MKDREKLYDEELFPLMEQIMSICETNNIPMFAVFQYAENGFCTSMKYDRKSHKLFEFFDAIAQSKEGDSVNIDKFMFWVMKKGGEIGHNSIILRQLDVNPSPNAKTVK